MKVKEIRMDENNGYSFPVFIMEDGSEYQPRQTATGNCWSLDWVKKTPATPQIIREDNLK